MEIEDQIRVQEIKDILKKTPPKLIRSGNIIVFVVLFLLITFSIIIDYPDIVSGNITLTTTSPPVKLIAKKEGRLLLLVKDGENVNKNQLVAYIENTADLDDIKKMDSNLTKFSNYYTKPLLLFIDSIELPFLNVGELQPYYTEFRNRCDDFQVFLHLEQNIEMIKSLHKQQHILEEKNQLLTTKELIVAKKEKVALKQLKIDSLLFKNNSISAFELDQTYQNHISMLSELNTAKENKLENEERLSEILTRITNISITDKDVHSKMKHHIDRAYKNLYSRFELWKKSYMVFAPIKGKISLFDYWNNNQFIKKGREILDIVTNDTSLIGKAKIPSTRFGKVKIGQKVKIMLNSYPVAQYGLLYGKVTNISEINRSNHYMVDIALTNGMITNYHKKLNFHQEMTGNIDIITEELNILQRIFYHVRGFFTRERE